MFFIQYFLSLRLLGFGCSGKERIDIWVFSVKNGSLVPLLNLPVLFCVFRSSRSTKRKATDTVENSPSKRFSPPKRSQSVSWRVELYFWCRLFKYSSSFLVKEMFEACFILFHRQSSPT